MEKDQSTIKDVGKRRERRDSAPKLRLIGFLDDKQLKRRVSSPYELHP